MHGDLRVLLVSEIHQMISQLPSKILRLLEFAGFSGNKVGLLIPQPLHRKPGILRFASYSEYGWLTGYRITSSRLLVFLYKAISFD